MTSQYIRSCDTFYISCRFYFIIDNKTSNVFDLYFIYLDNTKQSEFQEAEAFAKEQKYDTTDLKEIALKICNLPKQNENRPRVCVITQGCEPVLLAYEGKIKEFPVEKLPKEKLVDTNGAGDGFSGGFLAQYIQGHDLDVCVRGGIYAATAIIQRSGCTYEGKATFKP